MDFTRLPLIPPDILKRYQTEDMNDTRFRACARLLQSMWREDRGLPIGLHKPTRETGRALGSLLDRASARAGRNFMSPEIARLTRYESVYREVGALIYDHRLWHNLLSSQPLCFNLLGPMKLDLSLATRFWSRLFPKRMAEVEQIYFEHSPGRGDDAFIGDDTAFDILIAGRNAKGQRSFIGIEMKYSESMTEPISAVRPRHDDLAKSSGLFRDPDHPGLRGTAMQQFWREHLLCQAMLDKGLYEDGHLLVIHPAANADCAASVASYKTHLLSPDDGMPSFSGLTLETCLQTLDDIGEGLYAKALHDRYLNFDRVVQAIFSDMPAWDGPSQSVGNSPVET